MAGNWKYEEGITFTNCFDNVNCNIGTESGEDQLSIEGFVNRQMQNYPKSRLLDIYKSCFQDYMGAEHLVSDRQRVKAYLDEELNTTSLDDLMP